MAGSTRQGRHCHLLLRPHGTLRHAASPVPIGWPHTSHLQPPAHTMGAQAFISGGSGRAHKRPSWLQAEGKGRERRAQASAAKAGETVGDGERKPERSVKPTWDTSQGRGREGPSARPVGAREESPHHPRYPAPPCQAWLPGAETQPGGKTQAPFQPSKPTPFSAFKMPRGFLVKRTRREGPVSYRIRTPREEDVLPAPLPISVALPSAHRTLPRVGGLPESQEPARIPPRLVSPPLLSSCLDRGLNSGSPAPGESAPACASQSPGLGSACTVAKQAAPPLKRAGGGPREPAPDVVVLLGAFVCQLCQESYPGPLALAQHCCSRIARVEYRCHECSKAFSCPANLASHRRWHKPRGGTHTGGTKENESPEPTDAPAVPPRPGATEGSYCCSHCPKRFRRRAYLCKHLALHTATGPVLSESQRLHSNLAPLCVSWPKKPF